MSHQQQFQQDQFIFKNPPIPSEEFINQQIVNHEEDFLNKLSQQEYAQSQQTEVLHSEDDEASSQISINYNDFINNSQNQEMEDCIDSNPLVGQKRLRRSCSNSTSQTRKNGQVSSNPQSLPGIIYEYIPSEGPEYDEFGLFLIENFKGANSKNLCQNCWCLCNRYQMSKHKEQGHKLLTPKLFKDLEAFKSLAHQCGQYKQDKEQKKRYYRKITAHTEFLHSTSNQAQFQMPMIGMLNPEALMNQQKFQVLQTHDLMPNFTSNATTNDNSYNNSFDCQQKFNQLNDKRSSSYNKPMTASKDLQNFENKSQEMFENLHQNNHHQNRLGPNRIESPNEIYDKNDCSLQSIIHQIKNLYSMISQSQRAHQESSERFEQELFQMKQMSAQTQSFLDKILDQSLQHHQLVSKRQSQSSTKNHQINSEYDQNQAFKQTSGQVNSFENESRTCFNDPSTFQIQDSMFNPVKFNSTNQDREILNNKNMLFQQAGINPL
eukprot:403347871